MTDIQKSDGAIFKTDVRGRVQTPPERRRALIEEFERSGLSGPKFAALVGIKYQTFAGWVQRKKCQSAPAPQNPATQAADTVKWLEAVVEQAQNPGGKENMPLILRWPGGAQAELTDPKQVPLAAALIRALASSC